MVINSAAAHSRGRSPNRAHHRRDSSSRGRSAGIGSSEIAAPTRSAATRATSASRVVASRLTADRAAGSITTQSRNLVASGSCRIAEVGEIVWSNSSVVNVSEHARSTWVQGRPARFISGVSRTRTTLGADQLVGLGARSTFQLHAQGRGGGDSLTVRVELEDG